MGNAKKSILKLVIQALIVFVSIATVMYFMGLSGTFGIFGFVITALIVTIMIAVIFL